MAGKIICKDCGLEVEVPTLQRLRCDDCREKARKARFNHYDHKGEGTCPDCGKPICRRSVYCTACGNKHRGEQLRAGRNPNWKGGVTKSNGYTYLRVRPPGYKGCPYKTEHHVVWEAANGPLPENWVIHHLNGNKGDNRLENLMALTRGAHHRYPFKVAQLYEKRILDLEQQVRSLQPSSGVSE